MTVEFIVGGLIILGIIILIIRNKKVKNEVPEATATVLPIPSSPKRDSPN